MKYRSKAAEHFSAKTFSAMAALASLRRLALTSKATRTAPTAGYAACFALARGPAVKSFSTTAAVKVGSTDGDIFARTGLNPEIYTSRKVVIFKPPPSAISSGPYSTSKWHLSYAPRPLPLLPRFNQPQILCPPREAAARLTLRVLEECLGTAGRLARPHLRDWQRGESPPREQGF